MVFQAVHSDTRELASLIKSFGVARCLHGLILG